VSDCVFCRIVARQIPATVVHEDADTLAFMDIGQVNPGHVLVACKAHVENVYGLQDAQAAAVFRAAAKVARAIRAAFDPPGLSIYQANGKPAGQTVFTFTCTCCRAMTRTACSSSGRCRTRRARNSRSTPRRSARGWASLAPQPQGDWPNACR
jgi:galactose-1-phosphate uridylyltransferase